MAPRFAKPMLPNISLFASDAHCGGSNFINNSNNRSSISEFYKSYNNKVESDIKFTMSSKDLMMASKIKEMIDIGIVSLKVEGRMRSNYYVATVINTYRHLIDDYYDNKLTDEKLSFAFVKSFIEIVTFFVDNFKARIVPTNAMIPSTTTGT